MVFLLSVWMFVCFTLASAVAQTEEPAKEEGFFDALTWTKSSSIGLGIVQAATSEEGGVLPTRELRLTHKTVLTHGDYSLHLRGRVHANREFVTRRKRNDEPYALKRTYLPNGSVIDRDEQVLVESAYVQKLAEGWMLQLGSQPYAWGVADSVNPLSVFSQADLRRGFTSEKEQSIVATPSARLAILGESSTLNFVYAPWQQGALFPNAGQSWYLATDNLTFTPAAEADSHVKSQGSYALKYDLTVPNGDISLLAYQGADNELTLVPSGIRTVNNQPPVLSMQQVLTTKTVYGASLTQTLGSWVLKGEAAYSPNKKVLQDIDFDQVGKVGLQLPVPLVSAPTYQSTVGFNYFTPIKSILGAPLGDTVLTVEYYRQRYLKANVIAPQISDLLVTNVRTIAMEDRLEFFATYIGDLAKQGSLAMGKVLFHGETLRHSLTYGHVQGASTGKNKLASVFYYWRSNDFVAYDLTYPF